MNEHTLSSSKESVYVGTLSSLPSSNIPSVRWVVTGSAPPSVQRVVTASAAEAPPPSLRAPDGSNQQEANLLFTSSTRRKFLTQSRLNDPRVNRWAPLGDSGQR